MANRRGPRSARKPWSSTGSSAAGAGPVAPSTTSACLPDARAISAARPRSTTRPWRSATSSATRRGRRGGRGSRSSSKRDSATSAATRTASQTSPGSPAPRGRTSVPPGSSAPPQRSASASAFPRCPSTTTTTATGSRTYATGWGRPPSPGSGRSAGRSRSTRPSPKRSTPLGIGCSSPMAKRPDRGAPRDPLARTARSDSSIALGRRGQRTRPRLRGPAPPRVVASTPRTEPFLHSQPAAHLPFSVGVPDADFAVAAAFPRAALAVAAGAAAAAVVEAGPEVGDAPLAAAGFARAAAGGAGAAVLLVGVGVDARPVTARLAGVAAVSQFPQCYSSRSSLKHVPSHSS